MIPSLLLILILLFSSYIVGELFRKIGLPRVVGQISAGFIFGIGTIKAILLPPDNMEILNFLGNLGAILLFYYVGLETNFKEFKRNIKMSALISILNTSLPFIFGFIISNFIFRLAVLPSVIIGVCLSVSAQSVSVDILEELGMLKSKIGAMIVSAGAVDDTIELVFITTLLTLLHVSINSVSLGRFIIGIALFFMLLILARIWLIPFSLKFFDTEKSPTARFTVSLIIVLFIASVSEIFGLGSLIGAMLAGMIVRQTIFRDMEIPSWEEHQMASSIHLIAFGFLIPLFFVWVGVHVNLSTLPDNYLLILIFSLVALLGTVGGTLLAVRLNKGSLEEGLLLGWGLTPKGDVELILAASALGLGIITDSIFTSIVMMSIITTIVAPIFFKRLIIRYNLKSAHARVPAK